MTHTGRPVVVVHTDLDDVVRLAASGRTQAVVTLSATDVRAIDDADLLAVRPLARVAG